MNPRILFDEQAPAHLPTGRAGTPGHFVIGPHGHPGLRALQLGGDGQVVHQGEQSMWTDSPDVGPTWCVRRSVGEMGPSAHITATHNGFAVDVDRFATFPVHRLLNREGEFRADRVDLIAAVTDVDVDEVSVAQHVLFGHIFGPRSIVLGTERNTPSPPPYLGRQNGSPEQVADALCEAMAALHALPAVLPLSGGNDSRGLLLAALRVGCHDLLAFTSETGGGVDEPRIAMRVAADLGIDLGIIRLPSTYVDDWFIPSAVLCDYGWEQSNPWSLTMVHGAQRRSDGVLADGLGGDFMIQNKSGPRALDIARDFEIGSPHAARSFVEWRLGYRLRNLGWALPHDLAHEAIERAVTDTAALADHYGPRPSTFSLVHLSVRSMPSVVSQSLWWHPKTCFPYLAETVWSAIEQVPLARRFDSDVFQQEILGNLDRASTNWPSTSQSPDALLAQGLVDDSAAPRTAEERLTQLRELASRRFCNHDFELSYGQHPTAVQIRALCGLAVGEIAGRNFEHHRQQREAIASGSDDRIVERQARRL